MTGCFITFEGSEGSGKSTNLEYLREKLEAAGKAVVVTREPGGTALGEAIRSILLNPDYRGMSSDAELLLMFAARAQHIAECIRPALAEGKWVLSDRFTDASYAYQGGGRGIPQQRIAVLEQWVQGTLRPHLTLLLDVPPELGLVRAKSRSQPDRFEREAVEFFNRVRNAYQEIAAGDPERFRVIDAARTLEQVQHDIDHVIAPFLVETC